MKHMPKPPLPLTTLLGKAVREVAKLRGGGSALPGLFVESIDKDFIRRCLEPLPRGVIIISGTNGKTTTTKMVVELLESQGLNVFTNRTGSNFTRGVAAALLGSIDNRGKLSADIAVLELDEAHAVHFVASIKPRYSLLLNVMRDQLDRFGEIDTTARMLQSVAEATTGTVVVNREDPRLLAASKGLPASSVVAYFGLDESLRRRFPSDDDLRGAKESNEQFPRAVSVLEKLDGHRVVISVGGATLTASLKLEGVYNVFNAVAAIALVKTILGDEFDIERITQSLENITPAFGRGEKLIIDGQPFELVLVKNPGGFRLGLSSFDPTDYATMIAINDNYADGRDMSWLWDVEFDSLKPGISHVSGIRAYDMALRLQYDEVEVNSVEPNLKRALAEFIRANSPRPKRVYCTYTAMLALRRELSKLTTVEVIS